MLREYLNRVIRYEDGELGEWHHKVDVVAGVGGWAIADGAIELVTRRFLTDGIPRSIYVGDDLCQPNKRLSPNPFEFHSTLVNRLNSGSLFWIYLDMVTLERWINFKLVIRALISSTHGCSKKSQSTMDLRLLSSWHVTQGALDAPDSWRNE